MTVLAVPATSVPSERVFSSSGRTDTPSRNRLSPIMMEALQTLKFTFRNRALDFGRAMRDNAEDLEAVEPEELSEADLRAELRGSTNKRD
jgi:hAT family C-terminal dimerisation region